jgi:hypothetical protein
MLILILSHVDLDPIETIGLIHKGFTAETNEIIQKVHLCDVEVSGGTKPRFSF